NLVNRVWYVKPGAVLTGDGRSNTPFNNTTLVPSLVANDIVFVYSNGGVTTSSNAKINLNAAGAQLIGQGVTLTVNGFTLVTSSTAPTLTATANDVVAVNSGNTIAGVILTNATNNLITGAP